MSAPSSGVQPPAPAPAVPDLEPEPTPYEVWLTDDPQAIWDDPDLRRPADRQRQAVPEANAGR